MGFGVWDLGFRVWVLGVHRLPVADLGLRGLWFSVFFWGELGAGFGVSLHCTFGYEVPDFESHN